MSIDMAKEFLAKIATDPETAEKAKRLAGEALVDLARQMGYVFSESDLQHAAAGAPDPSELSIGALDGVSGGLLSAVGYGSGLPMTSPLNPPQLPNRLDSVSGALRTSRPYIDRG